MPILCHSPAAVNPNWLVIGYGPDYTNIVGTVKVGLTQGSLNSDYKPFWGLQTSHTCIANFHPCDFISSLTVKSMLMALGITP